MTTGHVTINFDVEAISLFNLMIDKVDEFNTKLEELKEIFSTPTVEYSEEAQGLAFAWESVGTPLDEIAEMHIKMQNKIKELNRKDK